MHKLKIKIINLFLKMLSVALRYKQDQELTLLKEKFKKVGANFTIKKDYSILNAQNIEIGDNFSALERFRIETWEHYKGQNFSPRISIGDNVIFNTDIHIGAINSITIGNNCLFASRIFITDHQHGDTSDGMIKLPPKDRPLVSSGPILIKDNVWVGEGVVIMPNVTIGANSIIAANAVVTKNVPDNSVVAGVPAKVIKQLV